MTRRRAGVLLYVLYPSHFKVMFRVARLLAETGRYVPVIYFDAAPLARDVAQACEAGIACLGPDGSSIATSHPPRGEVARSAARTLAASRRALARVPAWLHRSLGDAAALARFIPDLALHAAALRRTLRRYRRIVREHAVALVIAPGDNIGYGTPALFKAAHEAGVKTLIVPFTVSNRLEMVADLRRHRRFSTGRLENRLLARAYPHWALEHGTDRMVRDSASRAFVLEWAGVAPPDPWVLNSGAADAIAVESQFMWDYYMRAGLPPDRFALTGTLGDDAAARTLGDAGALRVELCAELGLDRAKRIVLFSYGEYGHFFRTGRPSEFSSQEDLTAFWLDSLRAMTGFEVVLSLHPWLRREDMSHLETGGVRIATRPIEVLIPLCDVYVVSISATVRTAIACGKPVVDHDVFDFGYDNFVGLDAVWIEKTKAGFAGTLARLARDDVFYREALAAQRVVAPRFGVLDAAAGARILSLVDRLSGVGDGS